MEAQLLDIELPILGTGNNPRSLGLHLTEVIRDLQKVSGLDSGVRPNWKFTNTIDAGFIWEEVLFSHWEEVFSKALGKLLSHKYEWYQTGEVRLDGIIGTPDGLDISEVWTLQEAKFTWKSVKNNPIDNFYYMTQAKSYCRMLNIDRVLFHIFYCNGNWRGSGPIYQPWFIKYEPHEIAENWQMILNW
jgi:hypothetical protein